jgi:carbamoyltransferase
MCRFSSLGGMYSSVAQQIFGNYMEAGKVMGLAPFGRPRIPVHEFLELDGNRLKFSNKVQKRFKNQERWPTNKDCYEDLAASVQRALEFALLHMTKHLRDLTDEVNLCMAGGVALNSVANQRIIEEVGFKNVYVIPSAEDSGVAIGAAYLGLWELGRTHCKRQLCNDGLGRTSASSEIDRAIQSVPDIVVYRPANLLKETAARLSHGQIAGWFQDGSELGPRALGQRSILCSPCPRDAKEVLNARVKFRESFRPFAPAILAEEAPNWFDFGYSPADSPFMLRVVPFRPQRRACVPAVVHVDGTGRLQTVTQEQNGLFHDLIRQFHTMTGVPILLNTSMNVQGEPIVETPTDAIWCLLGTGLDFCVIHDWLITKREGFRTILDYVPEVVADEYTIRLKVSNHALETNIHIEDAVSVRTSTPWGKADISLPLRLLPILSKVDGRRDGHSLADVMSAEMTAQNLVHELLLLRRMHMIRFRRSHVGLD